MITRNPVALLEKKDRPKVGRKTVATIDADATAHAIEAALSVRLMIPILLGSMCGIRRGEITAARWKSCNLDRRTLAIIASTANAPAPSVAAASTCIWPGVIRFKLGDLVRLQAYQSSGSDIAYRVGIWAFFVWYA